MGRRRTRDTGWIWLGLVGIGGVALGSFLAQMFLAAEPTDTAWYMERRFDFGQYGSGAGITREGWRHEESVTWMDAANASLAVPVEKENDRLVMVLKGVLPKGEVRHASSSTRTTHCSRRGKAIRVPPHSAAFSRFPTAPSNRKRCFLGSDPTARPSSA